MAYNLYTQHKAQFVIFQYKKGIVVTPIIATNQKLETETKFWTAQTKLDPKMSIFPVAKLLISFSKVAKLCSIGIRHRHYILTHVKHLLRDV